MPHTLTDGQKQLRVQFYRHLLKRFEEGQSLRVFDIITGNESCFYHYDPELKKQRKACLSTTDQRPSKVHRDESAREKKGSSFFIKSSLIKSVTLETGTMVNASWYVNTYLPQVFSAMSERLEMRGLRGLRGLIFHGDNAQPHWAWITNKFLLENHVEQYENAAYSPD